MNNFNHANDQLKAPHCDSLNNGSEFIDKMHHLESLLRLLESAYEGFCLANNYRKAPIDGRLQIEGQNQVDFYIRLFEETLSSLSYFFDDIKNSLNTNIGGK